MSRPSVLAFDTIARPGRPERLAIAIVAGLVILFLPLVVWKTVSLGHGDVQVFFRAAWAVWTGYPLYEVTDHHGWTYHYPPTFALLMGFFANPLPGHPQPIWALPYAAAVAVWYLINAAALILSVHLWAGALERHQPLAARPGILQGAWLLRVGPLLALLPFLGDGLVRGQPAPVLLLLVVAFLVLYVEKREASAACAFALAFTIKLFPIVLAVIPLLRRDWRFLLATAGWGVLFLFAVPLVCLGPTAALDLYRALWIEHLAGIVSGSMSDKIASEVSPGGYSSIGVGAVVARIAAGGAFYSAPLPAWASAFQYLFDALVVGAVVVLGRGGFWNRRGAQPAAGYPLLAAGAVLLAAMPLMISFAGPQYATFAVPLVAVLLRETWRRLGQEVVTGAMLAWVAIAWLSMIALEVPWNWLKIVGPMTWALLLLAPASLLLMGRLSMSAAQEADLRKAQAALH